MKPAIYIACALDARARALELAGRLRLVGLDVVSRWHDLATAAEDPHAPLLGLAVRRLREEHHDVRVAGDGSGATSGVGRIEVVLVVAHVPPPGMLEDEDGVSGGSRRNAAWAAGFTTFGDAVPAWRRRLLTDATTSGGLLVAVDPLDADALPGTVVGRLGEGPAGTIGVL